MSSILDTWARSTMRRLAAGGDLHRRPLTRAEMTAPLAWHEEQLARPRRFGELEGGGVGYEDVSHLRGGAR